MAKADSPWQDPLLRRLAKHRVSLPLEVSESTHADLTRRIWRIVLILVAVEFVALAALFAIGGILPGFVDHAVVTGVDADTELNLALALFGLPIGSGLLVRWLIQRRVRRRDDEADHPWRFQATAEGLAITSATGRELAGPWSDWAYAGYQYLTIKSSRIPTGLYLANGDDKVLIEFSRFPRRAGMALAAAVLQGLAAVGHTDR